MSAGRIDRQCCVAGNSGDYGFAVASKLFSGLAVGTPAGRVG